MYKTRLIIIILVGFTMLGFTQSLNQEYRVKQDYKKAEIKINDDKNTLTVFGKDYNLEESYYLLRYAIIENGDYLCVLRNDHSTYEYMDEIARKESRYKVCLIGGSGRIEGGVYIRIHDAVWVLRKNH